MGGGCSVSIDVVRLDNGGIHLVELGGERGGIGQQIPPPNSRLSFVGHATLFSFLCHCLFTPPIHAAFEDVVNMQADMWGIMCASFPRRANLWGFFFPFSRG